MCLWSSGGRLLICFLSSQPQSFLITWHSLFKVLLNITLIFTPLIIIQFQSWVFGEVFHSRSPSLDPGFKIVSSVAILRYLVRLLLAFSCHSERIIALMTKLNTLLLSLLSSALIFSDDLDCVTIFNVCCFFCRYFLYPYTLNVLSLRLTWHTPSLENIGYDIKQQMPMRHPHRDGTKDRVTSSLFHVTSSLFHVTSSLFHATLSVVQLTSLLLVLLSLFSCVHGYPLGVRSGKRGGRGRTGGGDAFQPIYQNFNSFINYGK